jgi:hypothetical protein
MPGEAGKTFKGQDDNLMTLSLHAQEGFRQDHDKPGGNREGRDRTSEGRRKPGTAKGGFNPLVFYDRLPQFDALETAFLTSMLPGKEENAT